MLECPFPTSPCLTALHVCALLTLCRLRALLLDFQLTTGKLQLSEILLDQGRDVVVKSTNRSRHTLKVGVAGHNP